MMNILLINPAYPNTFWSFKYALEIHREESGLASSTAAGPGG
jgi:hypothetical protein